MRYSRFKEFQRKKNLWYLGTEGSKLATFAFQWLSFPFSDPKS